MSRVYYRCDSPGRFDMKSTLKYLIAAALILTLLLPAGVPAGESSGHAKVGSPALKIGLGIEIDAEWISLNGSWRLDDRSGDAENVSSGTIAKHEVQLGSVPNFFAQAQKGVALFRAVRTTTVCLAKQWLRDRISSDGYLEGK
jgi:hypothetical protein